MPTVGNSTHKSSALNGKSNIMNQSFQTEQTSKKFTADFANFDQASFGDRNGKYPSSKYLKLQVYYNVLFFHNIKALENIIMRILVKISDADSNYYHPPMCESNKNNMPKDMGFNSHLYTNSSKENEKTFHIPLVSSALSTATESVFSTASYLQISSRAQNKKDNCLESIIIPPPPGFKPPITKYSSPREPAIREIDSKAATSNTTNKEELSLNIDKCILSNHINNSMSLSSAYSSKASNAKSKIKSEIASTLSSTTLHCNLQATNLHLTDTYANQKSITHSSQKDQQIDPSKNLPDTFISPNLYKQYTTSNRLTKQNDHVLSDRINIAGFSDKDSLLPNIRRTLPPKYENSSLPDLTIISINNSKDCTNDDCDIDLSGSCTSFNPFLTSSIFSRTFNSNSITETQNMGIKPTENNNAFIEDHLPLKYFSSQSNDDTMLNSKRTNSISGKSSNSVKGKFDFKKTIVQDVTSQSNPFYTNEIAPCNKFNELPLTTVKAIRLGEDFFAGISTNRTSPKMLHHSSDSNINQCANNNVNEISKSIVKTDAFSVNRNVSLTKITNFSTNFPPMTAFSATTTENQSEKTIKNADPPTPDSNTNGDLTKIAFASTEQKNSIELQKTSDDTAGDRYAALKDLDDMFKSTVMSESKIYS